MCLPVALPRITKLSGSREAVTYVLIDPFKQGGDFITMGSVGKT